MDYKPSDVFVGLVDFFGIMLPGAMLTFAFKDALVGIGKSAGLGVEGEAGGWVAFVLCAFLVGQFVQLLASSLDTLYERTYLRHRRHNGWGPEPIFTKARGLVDEVGKGIPVMKWARAYVRIKNSPASGHLDQLQATSKFFRGAFVVFLLFAFDICFKPLPRGNKEFLLSALIGALLLSVWLFCVERWRYTETTYLYFIELKMYGSETPVEKKAASEKID